MKKIFTIVILSVIGITQINAQCFQCDSITKAFSIGVSTIVRGNNSFAGGFRSTASGENSFVFGDNAKVTQSGGIAFGNFVEANAANSIVFGKYVTGNADNSITMGIAGKAPLINDKPNSITFGVTAIPSLTIVKPTGANLGYLGIGTDNPKELVHVTGNILSEGDLTVKDKIILTPNYEGNTYWEIERNSNGLNFVHTTIGNNKTPTPDKGTSPTYGSYNRLFINDNNGYVGIGTTTPAVRLDVNGSLKATNANITNTLTANALSATSANITNTLTTNALSATSANISGKVNIGTSSSKINLDVKGIIRTEEIKVCLNQGCDYVFEDDYKLMNLNDLNSFIKTHKHLPDVAPAAKMEAEGINVSEMNALLLQKVEELTLYILDLQNQINELKKQ